MNGKLVHHSGVCLNDLDAYFWYSEVDRSVGSYDLDALKTLSKSTKVYPNPEAFEVGLDKFLSHTALINAGVDVADTVLFSRRNLKQLKPLLEGLGACILKPRR